MKNPDKTFYIDNENKQLLFGDSLAKACNSRSAIIFLQGQLGAGKTTLVRGFLQGLGYLGKVKSPSYTLIETYSFPTIQILHVDLYRINQPEEVISFGLADLIDDKTICLIEWPEQAKEWLPPADLTCYIAPFAEGRRIQLITNTERGEEIVNTMAWV